jgi:hypothetical protein
MALFLFTLLQGACFAVSLTSVEDLEGWLEPGQTDIYTIPGLQKGDRLYLYAYGTSGNLDPFLAISRNNASSNMIFSDFKAEINRTIQEGLDPLEAVSRIAEKYFLAGNDDGGEGYNAALEFLVPESGDYQVEIGGTPLRRTYGKYLLQVGVNAPQVLTGKAKASGQGVAHLEKNLSGINYALQEIRGSFYENRTRAVYRLRPVEKGDILYAFAESDSQDFQPILVLRDYSNKTLATRNLAGHEPNATLQFAFDEASENNVLIIELGSGKGIARSYPAANGGKSPADTKITGAGITDKEITDIARVSTEIEDKEIADFRLVIGINAPEALSGRINETAGAAIIEPIEIRVGLELDQITAINQKDENFDVVANLRMQWTDPKLAFSPQECNCSFKIYRSIEQFESEYGAAFPEFTLYNQQGNRWTQNEIIVVQPDGKATYFERFWVKLQAPDFDFRKYPLDRQDFYVRIESLYPEDFFNYVVWPEKTSIGNNLGEEEWYVVASDANVSSANHYRFLNPNEVSNPAYSFRFQAGRHPSYYALRILLPIFIIVFISWITLFLKDYGKRADIAGANLLLFIAFNFTIGSDLPRLGYLTLMDWMMSFTFILTALIFIYNIYLKLLEIRNKKELAERIDRVMIWMYPLLYLTTLVVVPIIKFNSFL